MTRWVWPIDLLDDEEEEGDDLPEVEELLGLRRRSARLGGGSGRAAVHPYGSMDYGAATAARS